MHTGIDTDFYYSIEKDNDKLKIIIVGSPLLKFKGFELIIMVLDYLWKSGLEFEVTWATQEEFSVRCEFLLKIALNVSQEELAMLYRTHDLYIGASVYEAFSMPPLEAMASGTAVVSTDCGGINVYAEPGVNMLMAEQGSFMDLATAIVYLAKDKNLRNKIAENGRKTALKFSIEKSIDQLENIIHTILD